jgi:hypothetical protein
MFITIDTDMIEMQKELLMEKTRFNASLEPDEYKLLKMDAVRKGVNIRSLIADVLTDYIKILRKEGLTLGDNGAEETQPELDLDGKVPSN